VKALVIAGTNLRRIFRQRANIFFLLVLPLLIILLLGAAFGGNVSRIGVVATGDGPLAAGLLSALEQEDALEVERVGSEAALLEAVERGRLEAGLVLPAGYDAALSSGGAVALRWFARPESLASQLRGTVESAVAGQSRLVRAARFVVSEAAASFEDALDRAAALEPSIAPVGVRATVAGDDGDGAQGRFDEGASTQLLLFIFLTSLTGAGALIESRRLGISRRMLATPTSARTVLLGEALGRFGIALTQALLIVAGAGLLFGVVWGDPLGVAALVLAFCLVGSGAGMLLGSLLTSDQQAGAMSLLLGLGLAALGGSMVPLEVFPDTMRDIAHVTPHAWGNDAFTDLIARGGGFVDVLPEIAVLLGFAGALLALATWRLRRAITR
jgi:ABC-2 type transport system permease protein